MFGVWRLLLAIEVVAYHLLGVPIIGRYAVFSFFVLSGFLMTAIMQGTYGYTSAGLRDYAQNRMLRLFPNYWFSIAVSLLVILLLGEQPVRGYMSSLAVPRTAGAWAENLTMIFANLFPRREVPRLSPSTWALTIEICFYALIGLGASRSARATSIWLALSIAYIVVARLTRHGGDYFYEAIPAGSLPFAVGAAAFHHRDRVRERLARAGLGDARLLVGARWVFILLVVVARTGSGGDWVYMLGNWLNIPISGLIVCALYFSPGTGSARARDKAWGDLSYPTYLLHWQMGALASILLFGRPVHGASLAGLLAFAAALALTLLAGLVCARLIDPAVERFRSRIRGRTRAASPAPAGRSAVPGGGDPP